MKPQGRLTLQAGHYRLDTQPHVRLVVKRLFLSGKVQGNAVIVGRTADTTETMLWVLDRWPHTVSPSLLSAMRFRVECNHAETAAAEAIMDGGSLPPPPPEWNPAFPLREYQRKAVTLAGIKRGLLIGDSLGLGKTATAIGIIAANPGKSIVVCYKHLQKQWQAQLAQFCPSLKTHIIRETKEYELPPHDVTIITYSKLWAWADRNQWRTVIYDEVQELRASKTAKSEAAGKLAAATEIRIGLSATPVYNYAGEIFNIMEALAPGSLGDFHEFCAEWGVYDQQKLKVKDPEALGAWMRGQHIFIRRHRRDVGRELPPVQKIVQIVDHNKSLIDRLSAQCNELAEKVLSAGFAERGQAARQLDIRLRQITGIAKAPAVADAVAQLVAGGEQVLLLGWHREVYEIWQREFHRMEIPHAFFTGTESEAGKARSVAAILSGEARVLIMSLRAGAGLDGLQTNIKTVVIGELDWSPQVINQCIGRLNRDGQTAPVTAITCISEGGADPIMAGVLGAKWEQSTSITDPDEVNAKTKPDSALNAGVPENRMKQLATEWLKGKTTP